MTKQERERFLADLHVGIISIPEEGWGPLSSVSVYKSRPPYRYVSGEGPVVAIEPANL